MNIRLFLQRHLRRFNLPTLSLLAFLQRTPVVPTAIATEEFVMSSPIGAILKSFVAAASALGAMNSLAGATPLVPSSGTATGISIAAGTMVSPGIAFTVTGTQTPPRSWDIKGQLPAGMDFSGATGPAVVNVQSLVLGGTPTVAGVYPITLQVFEFADKGGYSTAIYNYTITVTAAAATAPAITTQPQSQTVTIGANVTLSVVASGSPTPTYQWKKDGAAIASATGASLALSNVQTSNAGTYTVVATNSAGAATSTGAVLAVNAAPGTDVTPTVTVAPHDHSIATGGTVVLDVTGAGGNLGYQWKKGGSAILGATSRTLVLANAQASDAGSYTVTLTNTAGAVTSAAAALTVTATGDAGRIVNVAVRTTTGTGNDILIVGFVTGGPGTSGTKDLLIRGVGPRLTDFSVPNVLADPIIQVIPLGSTSIAAQNDNWGGDAQVTSTAAALGAFPLTTTTSKDSALIATLASGPYSVKVLGANNTTGTALAEVYDASPGADGNVGPRLINVSARAQMSNDNPIIAGFVIGGATAKTVMIRAIGPALTHFGVAGAMADPKLAVYGQQGGASVLLTGNDDWAGAPELASTAAAVGGFALPDPASKDAVLLLTLDPGVYTAQVNGANNTSGIALLEVYAVP
jgi:hypothetical protein